MADPKDPLFAYARRVATSDSSWIADAACAGIGPARRQWFQCAEKDEINVAGAIVTGLAAQKMAETICFSCPVQWECTREAINLEHDDCVWGVRTRHLRWLRQQPNPHGIIDTARVEGVPVQVAVQVAGAGRCIITDMQIYTNARLDYDGDSPYDDDFPIKGAKIIHNGRNVTLTEHVPGGKARRIDRLTEATVREVGGKMTISGVSELLHQTMGLPAAEAAVTFTAAGYGAAIANAT